MPKSPLTRAITAAIVAATLTACTAPFTPDGTDTSFTEQEQAAARQLTNGYTPVSSRTAKAQLARLTVATPGSMSGYSRDAFPHWRDASTWGWPEEPNDRCNVRNAALYRDGTNVKIAKSCIVRSGTWLGPYTAKVETSKSEMDIDHIVSLAAAWRAGANTWTDELRTQFANDPLVVISANRSTNRAKGDKTAEAWKPPNEAAWCLYAKRTTAVKTRYDLTVTAPERRELDSMLGTCTA